MTDRTKKILFFIMIIMLFNINSVKAEECSTENLNQLKELAKNIFVDVEFNYEGAEVGIENSNYVTVQGLPNELYIYTDDLSVLFTSSQQNESGQITRLVKDGISELYVYSLSCPNEIIRKISITLNTFNPYSEYEECQGEAGKDLEICDEFYDKKITEEEFLEEIEKYEENNQNNDLGKDNKLIKILLPIISVIVIVLTIIFIIKKVKDNRLD